MTIGGPIWTYKIHNVDFVKRLMKTVEEQKEVKLGTKKRIMGILTGVVDEEPLQHVPLNYDLSMMASNLRVHNPSKAQFLYAMSQLGHKAVQTYYSADLWKTDAPPEALYRVLAKFKQHELNYDKAKVFGNIKETAPGFKILEKYCDDSKLDFDIKKELKDEKTEQDKEAGQEDDLEKILRSVKKKQKKYFDNPEPNWGPKARAGK